MSGQTAMGTMGRGWVLVAAMFVGVGVGGAQESSPLIQTLLEHETTATDHRGHYLYESEERSDRTGGHLWRERVAETNWGKVKYLIAEDGQPLGGDRLAAEKARVGYAAAHPDVFKRSESARVDDEQHAKQMLTLLPKAFLFDAPVEEGANYRVKFRPNPDYTPATLEERVLHAMNGSVIIDRKEVRLRGLEGRIAQDVSIGFGLLATIHAGSNFATERGPEEAPDWKTEKLHTDIKGKALFLKTIARQQESKHWGFRRLPQDMTVADAVGELEK